MVTDLVERLKKYNGDRKPKMTRLKYQHMRTDPFVFFRGTCHLFYEDWPTDSPLNNAPPVWICGDLHPENFGTYKGENRQVYFDVNDFDEGCLAPCTWEIGRLVSAFFINAPLIKVSDDLAASTVNHFLGTYSGCLVNGSIGKVDPENSVGLVQELLISLKERKRKAFLDTHTETKGNQRVLKIDGQHYIPAHDDARDKVTKAVEGLGAYKDFKHFFKVLDVAHRVAGTGSLGIDRYVILVEGRGSPDGNFMLDLKEEKASSLAPYIHLPQPNWTNQAQRTVSIQTRFQAVPQALLTALTIDRTAYIFHELQPMQDRVELASWDGKQQRLEKVIETMAQVTAWGELRSSNQQGAAPMKTLAAFGNSSDWQVPLIHYAKKYASRNQAYFEEFSEAYDKGEFDS